MSSDPYATLGLAPGATEDEVSKAYRRLAKTYHPDLNQGRPEAARKMSEINRAYEEIKRGPTSSGQGAQGAYQPGQGWGGAGRQGEGDSGAYASYGFDPFDIFELFGRAYGRSGNGDRAGSAGRAGQDAAAFEAARARISMGRYAEALGILAGLEDHGPEWQALSAVANAGLGRREDALRQARTAVQMEPGNPEYRSILAKVQGGGRVHTGGDEGAGYASPLSGVGKLLAAFFFANLFFMFFSRLLF
jgi:molecular chaperone DnaJ